MGKDVARMPQSIRLEWNQSYTRGIMVRSLFFSIPHRRFPRHILIAKPISMVRLISGRLLPDWIPIHPWRWWVQCRVVYLPASYLWSNRVSKPLGPILEALREEIFTQKFRDVDFTRYRDTVAPTDAKKLPSILLRILNPLARLWINYLRPRWLLGKANKRIHELIKREDANSSYNCLAPVNKAFHMVALWSLEGHDSKAIREHRERIHPYLWVGEDGMTCSGTNGVQVWDTAFTIQAAVEAGLAQTESFQRSLQNALKFLDLSQIREDLDDPYRQPRKGGWPFSTKSNGYLVSDCAAESLKAVIMLQEEW
jgi:lanosterol synthase